MCLVSPCERNAAAEQVALRGARRQSGRRPDALDVEDHRRRLRRSSRGRRTPPSARCPGPDVDVIDARARPAGADHHAERRRSRPRPGRSRTSPCRSPCPCGTSACSRSATRGSDDDGVIGYQATTVTPAIMQPIAAAALPSTRILPGRLVHRLDADTDPAWSKLLRRKPSRPSSAPTLSAIGLGLLAQLLGAAPSPSTPRSMPSSFGQDAVVNHVLARGGAAWRPGRPRATSLSNGTG